MATYVSMFGMLVARKRLDHSGGITLREPRDLSSLLTALIENVSAKHGWSYTGLQMTEKCRTPSF